MPKARGEPIEGAILVGGQSRRMGRDKRTLSLGSQLVLHRIAEQMAPLTTRVRLIGTDRPEGAYEAQPDLRPGLGPLSGIHAALATAEYPWVLVVACDLPFVTTELFRGLVAVLAEDVDAAVCRETGRPVPVCAIYRTRCLGPLEVRLDRGELSAGRFVEALATVWLEGEALARLDPKGICLENVNTPEDYAEARRIAAAEG